MSQHRIAEDLGRKIASELQEKLQREIDLAQAVGLEPPALTAMVIELAAGMANAACLIGVQMRKDGVSEQAIYDTTLALVTQRARMMQARSLQTLRAAQERAR
ncbi:hypothetical protein [Sphingomonas profundi]|uniref:hypothetical protein n=1 Tax=Alterirhizorhabdus profundi TaxID=2681549 RepID=UPI0012E7E8AB|nr:hypothetical protein [Sphingomonas profundi]